MVEEREKRVQFRAYLLLSLVIQKQIYKDN